jgi:hypothetical protein
MESAGLEHAVDDAEREAIADAVSAFGESARPHVAVVGDPFASRETLLDHAASLLDDVARIEIAGLVDGPADLPEAEAVVVDNCQYLYSRTVDGFAPLEAFADTLVDGDRLLVTGWNRHAWDYLSAVRSVDELFTVVVEVPPLSADALEALLTDVHDGPLPEFAADRRDRDGTLDDEDDGIALPGGRSLSLSQVSLSQIRDELGDDTPEERRTRVFETIAAQSNGNPRVARALWDAAVVDDTISPGRVRDAVPEVTLTDDEAFTLTVVLANETVQRDRLRAIVGNRRYRRSLRRLRHQGLVSATDEAVSIRPVAVPSATDFLTRRRLLW